MSSRSEARRDDIAAVIARRAARPDRIRRCYHHSMRSHSFTVCTRQRVEMRIITGEVEQALASLHAGEGICTIFTPHTTSAISINENADPDVLTDLSSAFKALVPQVHFDHGEGNSDAHLLSTIVGVSVAVPVQAGRLKLGRWQGIYFLEFDGPRQRQVEVFMQ